MNQVKEYLLKPDFATWLEHADVRTKIHVKAMIDHYIGEYKRFEPLIDPEDIAYSFYQYINEIIESDIKELKGDTISCKKGCSYCCKINVDISAPEAKLIIRHCTKNDICIDWNVLKKQSRYTMNTYHKLEKRMQKCIFLDSKGSCKIYEVRPVNCRLLFSCDAPKKCDVTRGIKQVKRFFSLEAEAIGTSLATAAAHGSLPEMLLKFYHKSIL